MGWWSFLSTSSFAIVVLVQDLSLGPGLELLQTGSAHDRILYYCRDAEFERISCRKGKIEKNFIRWQNCSFLCKIKTKYYLGKNYVDTFNNHGYNCLHFIIKKTRDMHLMLKDSKFDIKYWQVLKERLSLMIFKNSYRCRCNFGQDSMTTE